LTQNEGSVTNFKDRRNDLFSLQWKKKAKTKKKLKPARHARLRLRTTDRDDGAALSADFAGVQPLGPHSRT